MTKPTSLRSERREFICGLHTLIIVFVMTSTYVPVAHSTSLESFDDDAELEKVWTLVEELKQDYFATDWNPDFEIEIVSKSEYTQLIRHLHNTEGIFLSEGVKLIDHQNIVAPGVFVPLTNRLYGVREELARVDPETREKIWGHETTHGFQFGLYPELRRFFIETERAINLLEKQIENSPHTSQALNEEHRLVREAYDMMAIVGEGQAIQTEAYLTEEQDERGNHTGWLGAIPYSLNYGSSFYSLQAGIVLARSAKIYREFARRLIGNTFHEDDFDPLLMDKHLRHRIVQPVLREIDRVKAPHILFNMAINRNPWRHAFNYVRRVSNGHLSDQLSRSTKL